MTAGARWTLDALKEYFDTRIGELHREHDKFETTVRESFSKQNEFRDSLDDLGKTMATRRELQEALENADARFERIERWQSKLIGGDALLLVFLPVVTAIIVYELTKH